MDEDLDKVTDVSPQDVNRWIEDGHRISFKWVRDSITMDEIWCPHEGTNSICNHGRESCIVQLFLGVYGPELSIGEIDINGSIEIAWTFEPGESDLDRDIASIWVTPIMDMSYRSMKLALLDLGDA